MIKHLKKLTSAQLRCKLKKISDMAEKGGRWFEKSEEFNNYADEVRTILNRRNRAAIFKEACRCLRNDGENQFAAAARYADAVLDGSDYFSDDTTHEIGSFYTKSRHPVIVFFD